MKTIHKYTLDSFTTVIKMPVYSMVLTVKLQRKQIRLWVLVDPDVRTTVTRSFTMYGTGHKLPDNPGLYIGTVLTCKDDIVWHVFQKTEE